MTSSNNFLNDARPSARVDHAAGAAVRETQAAVNAALDALADSVRSLGDDAAAVGRAADRSLQHGMESLRDGSQALLEQARHSTSQMQHTIRADPMKSVLVAAASGAAVATVVSLLMARRSR
jgi:ElaB/YqjD/DUF883 family membrane-anchored ribosome-binding protein